MKLLITGATGFIGSHLCQELIKRGFQLRLLVRDRSKVSEDIMNKCEVFVGDLIIKNSLEGCCDGIDIVFNLAALTGHDSPSKEAFEKFHQANVEGLKNIVEEAKKSKVRRFIHISSTASMGIQMKTANELSECKPYTPYQVAKYEGERFILQEYHTNQFPAIIIRPCMIYGPGYKGELYTFTKLCNTGVFPRFGKGENKTPMLFVSDLVKTLINCIDKGREGEIYIVTSEQSYPLKDVANWIGLSLNKKIVHVYCPIWLGKVGASFLEKALPLFGKKTPVTKQNIISTVIDRCFDVTKAKRELCFEQTVRPQEGIKLTIEFYRKVGLLNN